MFLTVLSLFLGAFSVLALNPQTQVAMAEKFNLTTHQVAWSVVIFIIAWTLLIPPPFRGWIVAGLMTGLSVLLIVSPQNPLLKGILNNMFFKGRDVLSMSNVLGLAGPLLLGAVAVVFTGGKFVDTLVLLAAIWFSFYIDSRISEKQNGTGTDEVDVGASESADSGAEA